MLRTSSLLTPFGGLVFFLVMNPSEQKRIVQHISRSFHAQGRIDHRKHKEAVGSHNKRGHRDLFPIEGLIRSGPTCSGISDGPSNSGFSRACSAWS